MCSVKVIDVWNEGVPDIQRDMVNHFFERFKELSVVRPKLNEVPFRTLYVEGNQTWTSPFLFEELDEVVS